MGQLAELYTQSLLSFAAYASLSKGVPSVDNLKKAGMTSAQATDFASNWVVVDQYSDASGVSVTVFQENATGKRYLAVRGTESPGDFNADYILAMGFPSYLNPQFIQLREQISQWLSNGTLPSGFSVTGHSLGGYLAVAIGTWFSGPSNGIYTYNAPGLGGLVGNALDAFRTAFGFSDTTLVDGITNVRGTAGISLISGIGTQLAPLLFIETESNINPIANHSIVGVTDALAIANMYSKLDTSVDLAKFNNLFNAASSTSGTSFEGMLDALRKQFGYTGTTHNNNREQFYTNLYALQNDSYFTALQGKVSTQLATGSLDALAKSQFSALISLISLSPVVLRGINQGSQEILDNKLILTWGDTYAQWTADQALTPAQRAAGLANFSDRYLYGCGDDFVYADNYATTVSRRWVA